MTERYTPANHRRKLSGAAMLVFRASTPLQAAPLSLAERSAWDACSAGYARTNVKGGRPGLLAAPATHDRSRFRRRRLLPPQ